MSAASAKPPIHFSGPPSSLTATVDLPLTETAGAWVVLEKTRFMLRIVSDGNKISSLAFSMPDNTLPCKRKAEVIIGDFVCAATISVETHPKASVEPSTITVRASAGETVTKTVSVTNCGNSELVLDSQKAVTLRQSGTLGRNIAQALKQRDRDIADRLIALGQLIDSEQQHKLSVASRMRPASLAVDKSTEVTLELGVPEDIDESTTWTGSLAMLGTRLRVSVEPGEANP